MKLILLLLVCYAARVQLANAQTALVQIFIQNNDNQAFITNAELYCTTNQWQGATNAKGLCRWANVPAGEYEIIATSEGFASQTLRWRIERDTTIYIKLMPFEQTVQTVEVEGDGSQGYLRTVEGTALYASKKSEIIDLKTVQGNLACNNARQIYAKVAGLSIWENDNSGIQLNISARGMNPNRTANFNTRQNGYDISADALGYPEMYYSPPALALRRIELVRGAASLQYGTQFGGMLNFSLQNGDNGHRFLWTSETTYGSFNLINSFNSIGGTSQNKKFMYYGYYQYKQGDGWRPNSDFQVHNAYANVEYRPSERLSLRLEQTYMNYLAHQAGGLTDAEFSRDPRMSKRARNWFRVGWNISAFHIDYKINSKLSFNSRTFVLWASRESLGNLQPINRVDYGDNRDYIKGNYANIGNESRLMYRYKIANKNAILLTGVRIYKGNTSQQQGYANANSTGTRKDFQFLNPSGVLKSDYIFPSTNIAAFVEHYFQLSQKWSVTPGVRYEYIQTAADGTYQNLVVAPSSTGSGMDTLRNEAVPEYRNRSRSIVLAGIGTSYKPTNDIELYANVSQNYRAINFNDLRISNPNQLIDSMLQDERGYNADMGIRGRLWNDNLKFDVSLFYLSYQKRIGNIQVRLPNPENPDIIEAYAYRTNIGDARVLGLESLIEANLWGLFTKKLPDLKINAFVNASYLNGRYTNTSYSYANGKKLEFVSPVMIRQGLHIQYKNADISTQISYVGEQFSDATNAQTSPNATVGVIPAYTVVDATASYTWKMLRLQVGCNNLTNAMYFTRRATSYPGPGIISADGRSFYASLRFQIGKKLTK